MPSRSPRSRSRSPSRKHKKSRKRSRRSSDERSPSTSKSPSIPVKKEGTPTNENDANNSVYKPRLPSVMLPPSFLAKLDVKEKEKTQSPAGDQSPADTNGTTTQPTKVRKKRFGDETERVFLPGMPTTISATNMTDQQQKIYILQVQIEELTRRLKMNDLGIPTNPEARSPSPEPIYDQQGKRQNTREVRARRKIEEQRHQLVTELLVLNPDYKAPADYKPQQAKYIDKVMIPQEDHPDVNFVGLIIGPRGNTLKTLEKETSAKIIIRGKGSIKDGKLGLVKFGPLPGEDEPLHAYITGTSPEVVAKAVEKVNEIINRAIEEPEGMNELRKQQLRELALLQGTLRENDCLIKLKLMHEAEKIITNTIICTVCGGAGHVSGDCKFRKNPDGTYAELNPDGSLMLPGTNRVEQQKLDCEYQSLINELTGKKESDTNTLSFDDRKNLMSGTRTTGPTLAIAATGANAPTTSFNQTNGSMNPTSDYNPPSLMSIKSTNNPSAAPSATTTPTTTNTTAPSASSSFWSNTGPRYNNNDVFDGHYLLRRHNKTNNYNNYIEGDSYRAQHIPALMEGGAGGGGGAGGASSSNTSSSNSSSTWSNPQHSQHQQWNQWNQYNAAMYYSSVYQQQQYYRNNTTPGFIPPLPKTAPPPPPPPR